MNGEQAPLASLGRRTTAMTIDLLVLSGLVLVLFYDQLMVLAMQLQTANTPEKLEQFRYAMATFSRQNLPYLFALYAAYHAFLVGATGATPGKYLVRIEVVDAVTGARPGWMAALVRALGRTVGELLLLYATFVPAWFTERRQTLHDLLANTVVVQRKTVVRP